MAKLFNVLRVDFRLDDERGTLVQIAHEGYEQINVLASRAGALRGAHYHKECKEAFFVIAGSVDVALSRGEESCECYFKAGDFFEIEPLVNHRMHFPEDCVMVALYDKRIERQDGAKDIFEGN